MRYIRPNTLAEATNIFASGEFKILAGGTDLYPTLKDRPVEADVLDISSIPDIRGIQKTETGWRIGACTTWSDISQAALPACFEGLQMAAREIGSIQIQNIGTIGGNLCNASPAADSVPPLLTLNAVVEIATKNGFRTMELVEFVLGARKTALKSNEFVNAIHIPEQSAYSSFQKIGARKYLIISIVMVAVALEIEANATIKNTRICVGACSPVALRVTALEQSLIGAKLYRKTLSERIEPEHFRALTPIDDIRGDRDYRMDAVRELVIRLLLDCAEKGKEGHNDQSPLYPQRISRDDGRSSNAEIVGDIAAHPQLGGCQGWLQCW